MTLDYLVMHPTYAANETIGFNGQAGRKAIFLEVLERINFDLVLETGTWVGNTTGYLRETSGLPVFTCELNERYFVFAQKRLEEFKEITFSNTDSRSFLRSHFEKHPDLGTAFIYLDAHWYDDLPLAEELEIISQMSRHPFVIMIDDFEVPNDKGYMFDYYTAKDCLSMRRFGKEFERHGLIPFFPALKSSEETGSKTGCVLLAKDTLAEELRKCKSLIEYSH